MKTKIQDVYYHLSRGHPLTSLQAFEKWRVTRLADVVHELRTRYGLVIDTELVQAGSTRYAKYRLQVPMK
jgi:hypothetical protein